MAFCMNTTAPGTSDTTSEPQKRTAPASSTMPASIWDAPKTFAISLMSSCAEHPFMQTINRDQLSANSRITLTSFVEGVYLPWTKEEGRASTSKGHHEIWINHIRDRVGQLHLREFRTVDASRMLRAIAQANDLTTTTLQHIKSVLSTIFTYAKNEGAFDGANPVDGVLIPRHAKEPGETHAYDLGQVLQLLDRLPLLEKSLVATAALAGLRQGELRGLEWTDYTGTELTINRSIWMSVVNLPKTRASRDSVAGNSCVGGNLGRMPQVHG